MALSDIRANAALQATAFFLFVGLVSAAVWFQMSRRQLICASAADASWHMTYAGGGGTLKFMWSIEPLRQSDFLACLKSNGYDIANDAKTGVITADNDQGITISNSVGDGFAQSEQFYKW